MADDASATTAAYIPIMGIFPSAGPAMIVGPVWTAESNRDWPDMDRANAPLTPPVLFIGTQGPRQAIGPAW
jgi:hypothetical protein